MSGRAIAIKDIIWDSCRDSEGIELSHDRLHVTCIDDSNISKESIFEEANILYNMINYDMDDKFIS